MPTLISWDACALWECIGKHGHDDGVGKEILT